MVPTFLNLVPDQDPKLFPRKVGANGKIVNTSKVVGGRTFVRKPEDVTGIGIHQTACVFGPLDDPQKRHRRALKVPAHVLAFRDGVYAQSAPLLWELYHGNALNPFTLGLELEGQYPGLLDDPSTPVREDEKTFWSGGSGKPTPLDAQALSTFRVALAFLVEEGRRLGCPIKYIWAHRQANGTRTSDPGQEIWQRVVIDFGEKSLGLQARCADTWRDGRPIPKAWDPRGFGEYR